MIGSGVDLIESRLDFLISLPGTGEEAPDRDREDMEERFFMAGVDGERVMMRLGESGPGDDGVGERP
jgi:hypothetical protein